MSDAITRFTGKYRFLSNFYPSEVDYDGVTYRSVEHAYQAAKTLALGWRSVIQSQPTPGRAKKVGQKVPIRADWEDIKLDVMLGLLRQKFMEPGLRAMLDHTGDKMLIEGNTWGDRFWGAVFTPLSGAPNDLLEGENHLGRLLMQVREENRK